MGKWGRLLGIQCVFWVQIVFLLSLSLLLLTVPPLWIGKGLLVGVTNRVLRIVRLTVLLLRSGNTLRDPEHVLGQLVPMSCHFQDTPSI